MKLDEDDQLHFKLTRLKNSLTLELLQDNRSKIDSFEEVIGPHVFSKLCDISIPQVTENQRGVSFTWFSPTTTVENQYQFLLQQKNLDIECILFNSVQLAWYTQTKAAMQIC
ncbi:hypothetical protein ACN6MY_00520 [Peribacillus sp. B-H-3]|uniref:hypothetical protein n=1 Tax=Peribacillus sp. B-H-3 TaxID=3400420 RepID=UPI003B015925